MKASLKRWTLKAPGDSCLKKGTPERRELGYVYRRGQALPQNTTQSQEYHAKGTDKTIKKKKNQLSTPWE